jgi:hypothetical protein
MLFINQKNTLLYIFLTVAFLNVFFINNVFAADTIIKYGAGCTPEGCATDKEPTSNCAEYCGNYDFNLTLKKVISISEIILGLCGSLALLAFVVGGLMFLLSSGSSKWVERGKDTIFGAIIGLVIVFTSYAIINFVVKNIFNVDKINGQEWNQAPKTK